ncbi:response regulator transcription factor [Buttiauxella sp. B2]|uniref:helix-turn-helix transcriptional regulator n=1 Tax=Buttiauxella sp. B2 TaxID=2587812 RepID=UPI00111D3DF9|nr:LuxR C-terminal-related transcriptional regulator [Buttiauxella sp. B2]TNV20484.1 response regulator transcription factor [Buttiauxella sp. B2]
MFNILITGQDNFFRHGLESVFSHILKFYFCRSPVFHDNSDVNVIPCLDVIVILFGPGESYLCYPELVNRKKNCLVIGFHNSGGSRAQGYLPKCFSGALFLNTEQSVQQIMSKIICALKVARKLTNSLNELQCHLCRRRTLSRQQYIITERICNGEGIQQIAQELGISNKTVSSHKRRIMDNFNLKNTKDLMKFLINIRHGEQNCILRADYLSVFRYNNEELKEHN